MSRIAAVDLRPSGATMLGLFQKDICPIGIDVGNHSIRLLQLRRKAGQLALQAAARVDLEPAGEDASGSDRLTSAINRGLAAARFVGKTVVLSLPPATIHSKSVRLPQMPDPDLAQALQWEAKDRFGFEIGDGRIVWFRAGEVRRGTEIKDELLLFAIQAQPLSAHLDAAAAAGLTVQAIDLAACAMYRGAQRAVSPTQVSAEVTALLGIGHGGSQFLITRNDQLVFYKHIDVGGRAINEAVAQKLGITAIEAGQMRTRLALSQSSGAEDSAPLGQALQDAMRPTLEDLARELDMCMRYFVVTFRGSRPDLITLTGRQATCPWLIGGLSSSLGLRVEAAQPLRGVPELGAPARPDRSSAWSSATGQSLCPAAGARRMEAAA
jgi:type IV pilus assembly protein PilM